MARTLTGTIKAGFGLHYKGDIDLGSQTAKLPFPAEIVIGSGTGSGQSDLAFWDNRSLSASASEDLDLAAGLNDAFGQSLTFVEVNGIYVKADADNSGNIIVGGASSNAFTGPFGAANDTVALAAGESFIITNMGTGWTVTAGTGDLLKVANSHASAAKYDIAIIGRSA